MPDLLTEPESQELAERELGSMSLLQHLEELRKRIIYSLAAVAICFGVGWWYHEFIYEKMRVPIIKALADNHWDTQLTYLNPTDPFNNYLKIALIAGIFVASPFLLYQVWGFISPGLYRHEKRFVVPFLFLSVALFLSGGYFGYRVVFPVALDFLIKTGGTGLKPMITITEYTNFFLTIILGLALIFELPVVMGFAGMMGVVNAKFLLKHIRGAVLIFVIIAAILSPTTDVLNLCIYASPMILLYFLSIGIVWFVHPRQRKARRDKQNKAAGMN